MYTADTVIICTDTNNTNLPLSVYIIIHTCTSLTHVLVYPPTYFQRGAGGGRKGEGRGWNSQIYSVIHEAHRASATMSVLTRFEW